MTRPFLAARWENLAIITYAVPRDLLASALPRGCELDEHRDWPGMGLVSLVAFDFIDCRVLGVRWRVPGTRLVDFPEINLRFYIRGPRGRGVCFIREYVPSRLVGVVARMMYNEPYRAGRMRSLVTRAAGELRVEHGIEVAGRNHRLLVRAHEQPREQSTGVETFFKEHQWGYGRDRRGRPLVYEVRHPTWPVHDVIDARVDVDFATLYGEPWSALNTLEPISTVLAAGSAITVSPCGRC